MRDLKLTGKFSNPPGFYDLALENGDYVFIEDRLEVLQNVVIRLLWIRFEWIFDYLLGIPWFDGMFDIQVSKIQKENYIKKTIIQTPGVRALTAFEFNQDRENYGALVAFEAETIYGPISEEIII